jgi:hypothetical protein
MFEQIWTGFGMHVLKQLDTFLCLICNFFNTFVDTFVYAFFVKFMIQKIATTSEYIVSILASFCVWTKSLICKDAANRDSTVQSEVRRISKFPVSRPDDVSSRPDARHSSIIRPDDMLLPSGHFTVSRSFCASLLRPDVSAARLDAYEYK